MQDIIKIFEPDISARHWYAPGKLIKVETKDKNLYLRIKEVIANDGRGNFTFKVTPSKV